MATRALLWSILVMVGASSVMQGQELRPYASWRQRSASPARTYSQQLSPLIAAAYEPIERDVQLSATRLAAPASRKPYVIGGALLGATAMGVGLWIYSEHSNDDSLTHPAALAPAVVCAAALGALIGWSVHRATGER